MAIGFADGTYHEDETAAALAEAPITSSQGLEQYAMADMAPEGMRIPVAKTIETTKTESAGGGGAPSTLQQIRDTAKYKEDAEAWRKAITAEKPEVAKGFEWTSENI